MLHIRFAGRLGGLARFVMSLLAAGALGVAAVQAQIPAPSGAPDDPVEAFRLTLSTGRSFGSPTPEHLKQRKDRLEAAAASIRTLGDLSRALLLLEWNKPGQEPEEEKLDADVRDGLLRRFTQGVQRVIKRGSTLDRIAVANLIGETANAVRRQDIQVQESTRGVLDRSGRAAPGGASFLRLRMRELAGDLVPLADDPSPAVRMAAARALGNIEGDPTRTVPPVQRLLKAPETSVRRAAAAALEDAVAAAVVQFQSGMMPPSGADQSEQLPTEAEMWRSRAKGLLMTLHQIVPAASSGLDDTDTVVRRICSSTCRQASSAVVNLAPNIPQDLPSREAALDELTRRRIRELQGSVPLVMKELQPSLATFRRNARLWTMAAGDPDPEVRVNIGHVFEDLAEAARKLRRYEQSLQYPESSEPPSPKPPEEQASAAPALLLLGHEPAPNTVCQAAAVELGAPQVVKTSYPPASAAVLLQPAVGISPADDLPSGPVPAGTGLPPRECTPAEPVARPAAAAFEQKGSETLPPPAKAGPDVPAELERTAEVARQALVRNLSDRTVRVRMAALDALLAMGKAAAPALPAVVDTLNDPNLFCRWQAASILGQLAPRQPELVVPALARRLTPREDMEVRIVVANSLSAYGPQAKAAVPALAAAVNRGDVEVRLPILRALSRIGAGAEEAIPAIAQGLQDRSAQIRAESARVLGRFGPAAAGALPALRQAMADPDDEVRRAASDAVLAIDVPKPLP